MKDANAITELQICTLISGAFTLAKPIQKKRLNTRPIYDALVSKEELCACPSNVYRSERTSSVGMLRVSVKSQPRKWRIGFLPQHSPTLKNHIFCQPSDIQTDDKN
jgi:hypothetical protein